MRSRFLMELTTPEVEAYFKRGGKTAYIPAGAVEMHGPHLPIGTDMLIARAFALLMARETDGIVFPDVSYTWSGATDGFAGTVSIPPENVIELVTLIVRRARRMGFRRIVIVSMHGTNDQPMTICVRRLFETDGIAAQYLNPWRPVTPEVAELLGGKWAGGSEASMVLAALQILGQPALYTEKELAYDDQGPGLFIHSMNFKCATGFFYQDSRHHAAPSRYTSKKRALKYFELQVKAFIPGVRKLDTYEKKARKLKNQGWFRET